MEKELKEREIITTEEDTDKNNLAYFENEEKELKEIEARELKELELMNENENREFYVYEHIRLDNNTPFYVGKGTGNRAYNLDRGNFHNGVRDSYDCKVVIIKDKLTESQAFRLEKRMIEYYVLTLGYGIPIDGYMHKENNKYLTNFTWGGEGSSGYKHSKETKRKLSEANSGENNPMYGKIPWNKGKKEIFHHSEESKLKMSESMKGKNKGKKFSEEHKKNLSESHKGKQAGKNHPLYGKHHSDESKLKMSESHKGKLSKKVICITTGEIFNSQTDASNYYKCNHICDCCKGTLKSAGKLPDGTPLKWKYVKDYNNEFKGILINPWDKGKKLSEEHELKLSKVNSKKVICITTGKIFNSIRKASNYYNIIQQGNISYCCRGERKSAGKLNGEPLKWKFLENYNNEFKGILINPITD